MSLGVYFGAKGGHDVASEALDTVYSAPGDDARCSDKPHLLQRDA